jgi:hypothetical protein
LSGFGTNRITFGNLEFSGKYRVNGTFPENYGTIDTLNT